MIFRPPLSAATPVGDQSPQAGPGLWGTIFSKVTSGSMPTWCGFAMILVGLFNGILWLPFVHASMFPGELDALRQNSWIILAGIAVIGFRKNAKEKGWNQTIIDAAKVFYDKSIDTAKFREAAPPAMQRALDDLQAKADAGEIPHPSGVVAPKTP